MKRSSRMVSAFVVTFHAVLAPTLAAQQQCKPVNGHFEASVVPPGTGHCPPIEDLLCTAGRVWGGVNGTYEFVMTGAIPAAAVDAVPGQPATMLFFTGRSTVKLQSGDTLIGLDAGAIDAFGQNRFGSVITWAGGTGAAATATGQISLAGALNPLTAMTSGDYSGTFCTS